MGEGLAVPKPPTSEVCGPSPRSVQLSTHPPSPIPLLLYLEMFQHGPFLGKKQRTRRALKDTDTLGQQVLVEV